MYKHHSAKNPLTVAQRWSLLTAKKGKEYIYVDYWVTRTHLLAVLFKIKKPLGDFTHVLEYYNENGIRRLCTLLRPDEAKKRESPIYKIRGGR